MGRTNNVPSTSAGEGKPRLNPLRDALVASAVILVSACLPLLFLWRQSSASLDSEMRTSLQETALSAALLIDGDLHGSFTNRSQEASPEYKHEIAQMRKFMDRHPRLAYLYTTILRDGKVHFVLDAAEPGDSDGDGVDDHSYIMDVYDTPSEELLTALREGIRMVDREPYKDMWGTFISGYAPVRNSKGDVVAILGADISIAEIAASEAAIKHASLIGLFLAFLCSAATGFGVWTLRRRALYALEGTTQALKEREAAELRYRHLFEQSPIGVFNYNNDLVITDCNRRLLDICSPERTTLIGTTLSDDMAGRLVPCLRDALENRESLFIGLCPLTESSHNKWIEVHTGPVKDKQGQTVGGIATVEDITIRHRSEQMSDAEKKLLGMIARAEPLDGVLLKLVESIEALMPGSLCSILLLDEERKHLHKSAAPSLPRDYVDAIDGAVIGPEVGSCGAAAYTGKLVITPDIQKDPRWYNYRELAARHGLRSCWSMPVKSGRETLGTFAIYHHQPYQPGFFEISLLERASYLAGIAIQRSQFEVTISGERNLLRTLIDNLPDVIFIKDRRHCYLAANRAALKFLRVDGEESLIGKTDHDIFPRPEADAIFQLEVAILAGATEINRESTMTDMNGNLRHLATSRMPLRSAGGEIMGLIMIGRDVTDQRHIEEERIKTQKLESLGILAGGIAHDFNNILTSILGNLSFLKQSTEDLGSDNADLLKEAEMATYRAKELTQQLLTFAKGGLPVKRPSNVAAIVKDSATFALRGSSSRLVLQIAPDLWLADADAGQISQVVQNLVFNADQAMPGGGTITIAGSNNRIDVGNRHGLEPGDYVAFTVTDTGIGIDKSNLEKIYDPYFTTKKAGSGLGLTTTFSIIKKHGGHITVASAPGQGAAFTFYLPALPQVRATTVADHAPVSGVRSAHVLLMDDEEPILKISSRILERAGFTVSTARDGEQALQIYADARISGRPVEIAVLDLTIPGGMGGRETFERLREMDSDIKVIVSSGYSVDEILARHEDFGFNGVVTKPYQREELIRAINDALMNPTV